MSLINQMLKDLEKRAKQNAMPEITLSGLFIDENAHFSSEKSVYLLPVGIILLAAALSLTYLYKNDLIKRHHSTLPPFDVSSTKTNNVTIADNIQSNITAITPAILTGITFQVKDNITYINFSLNHDAYYTLEPDIKNNKLVIVFDNTNLIANIPPVDYMKSAIQGMEMSNDANGHLIINLSLNEHTDLRRLEFEDQSGKIPELQLEIESKIAPNQAMIEVREPATQSQPSRLSIKKPVDAFNIEQSYKTALHYDATGDNAKAVALLSELLTRYPKFADVRESLVATLIEHGNNLKAKQILETGLDMEPTYAPFIELKARILMNEGKNDSALYLLQQVSPPIDKNPEYHAMIAALYQRMGQVELASKLYEQLVNLQPNRGVWWMGLAIALESQGSASEAKEAYLRASNSQGLSPELKAFVQSRLNSISS